MTKLGNIISEQNGQASPTQLFQRLHEPDAATAAVIEELDAQKHLLRPEDIISHALKMDSDDGVHLLKLLDGTEQPIDLSNLSLLPEKIANPVVKINLLNYLGTVSNPKVPLIASRFLFDNY